MEAFWEVVGSGGDVTMQLLLSINLSQENENVGSAGEGCITFPPKAWGDLEICDFWMWWTGRRGSNHKPPPRLKIAPGCGGHRFLVCFCIYFWNATIFTELQPVQNLRIFSNNLMMFKIDLRKLQTH